MYRWESKASHNETTERLKVKLGIYYELNINLCVPNSRRANWLRKTINRVIDVIPAYDFPFLNIIISDFS